MTSHKEEALLSAAFIQTPTTTFPWVSILPTYPSDFTLASFHNYVSQFFEINFSLSLFFLLFWPPCSIWIFPAQASDQSHSSIQHHSCSNRIDATNPIMPQQEHHKSLTHTHTHTHSHTHTHTHTHTLLIPLLWKILTNTYYDLKCPNKLVLWYLWTHRPPPLPPPVPSTYKGPINVPEIGQASSQLRVFIEADLHAFVQAAPWLTSLSSLMSLDVTFPMSFTCSTWC